MSKVGDAKEVSSAFINMAEAELDSRLGVKYTVPFSDNNVTAKSISIDLSYLLMATTRSKNYDRIKERTDKWIEQLVKSEAVMVTDSGTLENSSFKAESSTGNTRRPIFTQPTSHEVEFGTTILPTSDY
jgi:phage gp36-like protein